MNIGLIGRKCGMSRLFTDDGCSLPVTLIEVAPNRVTQVKTLDNDGYSAVQVTTGTRRPSLLTKPSKGHYAKAKVEAGRGPWEFRLSVDAASAYAVGAQIKVDEVFSVGQKVDIAGITKGKGFQGTIKRHNFTMGDATHGNSLSHRAPGSIGQRQTPGRVFPGKRMSGHMGHVRRSAQNLEVVQIDSERHLIVVKGAVPGAAGGTVVIRPAAKA